MEAMEEATNAMQEADSVRAEGTHGEEADLQ